MSDRVHRPLFGSGSPTNEFGRETDRRCHRLVLNGGAPCEKVNFKVFNFTNGALLWQKLFEGSVYLGLDGRVWHFETADIVRAWYQSVTGAFGAETLPAPTATGYINTDVVQQMRGVAYLAADGAQDTVGAWMISQSPAPGPTLNPSQIVVDSTGNYSQSLFGATAPRITIVIIGNKIGEPIEYRLTGHGVNSGNFKLTSQAGTITFNVTDSPATVQSAISSAWGSVINSVTCSGTSLRDNVLSITIDWIAPNYLQSYEPVNAGIGTLGGCWIRNAATGNVVSGSLGNIGTSFVYASGGYWISNNTLVRNELYDAGGSSRPCVEVWDTSATPFSLSWRDAYLGTSGTTVVTGESKLGSLAAHNGRIAVGLPIMGFPNFSLLQWNADGTGKVSSTAGDKASGVRIADSGTELYLTDSEWMWRPMCVAHGTSCNVKDYGSTFGEELHVYNSGGTKVAGYNEGNAIGTSPRTRPGFNSTALAVIQNEPPEFTFTTPIVGLVGASYNYLKSLPTGYVDPGLPTLYHEQYFYVRGFTGTRVETCSWRLRWTRVNKFTIWLDENTTLAELNSALLTTWGVDIEDTPNCTAEHVNPLPTYATDMDPAVIWKNIDITMRCARTSGEGDASGMPEYFQGEPLAIEFQDWARKPTTTINALSRTTGGFIWSRGWSTVPTGRSVLDAGLLNGRLYCRGTKICIEDPAGDDPVITPPPDPPPPPPPP